MKKLALITLIILTAAVVLQAKPAFTFDSLSAGVDDASIGSYISSEYDSEVVTKGAVTADKGWQGNESTFITSGPESNGFEVCFLDQPVRSVSFDWFVSGADWNSGIDISGFADTRASKIVTTFNKNKFGVGYGGKARLFYDSGVSNVSFGNSGGNPIAIDNIRVKGDKGQITPAHAPAPGSLILGSIGIGIVGWLRRRRGI